MPRVHAVTSVKRGKWAAYNSRRAADRQADRDRRLARRLERAAAQSFFDPGPAMPPPPPGPAPLTLRITLEIAGERHRVVLRWCEYARQWSLSKRRLFAGLGALLDRAPEIHRGR